MADGSVFLKKETLAWFIIILLLVVSFFIIKPYISAILSAFVLAYLIRPVYTILSKKINNRVAAFVSVIVIVLVVLIPVILITYQLIHEASTLLAQQTLNNVFLRVSQMGFIRSLGLSSVSLKTQTSSWLIGFLKSLISYSPTLIIQALITFFGTYYLLLQWEDFKIELKRYLPFRDKRKIMRETSQVTRRILYGLLLIGSIEFLIALIGFYLSGVQFYLIFSLLIAFSAFTLILDPSWVWLPVAAYYFFTQDYPTAVGVLITGVILSTDFILRPKILGTASSINPFIMLLGIVGGISLFGLLGFIIGPVILFVSIQLAREKIRLVP